MPTVNAVVRWSDNTKQLTANLKEGIETTDKFKQAVDRTAKAIGGEGLFAAANKTAAAIQQLGGVTKLTAAEQERYNALFDKAIQKAQAMGEAVPAAWHEIAAATKSGHSEWDSFQSSFNPKEAIESPLNAATGAAKAFAGSLGPIGAIGTVIVTTLAAAGAMLFKFATEAAHVGGELDDLSETTGIAVPKLSGLKFAADVAGQGMDTVSNAIFKLQQNIGQGGEQIARGFNRIGLSLEQIRDLNPEDQFIQIAHAISGIQDPAQRAAAAVELFGKQGRDLLPLLSQDLEALTEQSKALGFTWSAEEAKAAEEFEMKSKQLQITLGNITTLIGKELIPLLNQTLDISNWTVAKFLAFGPLPDALQGLKQAGLLLKYIEERFGAIKVPEIGSPFKDVANAKQDIEAATRAIADEGIALDILTNHLKQAKDAVIPLTASQREWAITLDKGGFSAKAIAEDLTRMANGATVSETAVKNFLEANKKSAQEADKHAEAIKKLNEALNKLGSVLPGLRESLGRLDSTELESIKDWIKLQAELDKVEQHSFAASFGMRSIADSIEKVGGKTDDIEKLKEKLKELNTFVVIVQHSWADLANDLLQSFPQILQQAFTGGGGFQGAAKAFGSRIGGDISASMWSRIADSSGSNFFDSALGKMLGNAVPIIGSLLGPLISKLFSIGGPSKQELEGRDVEATFEKQFGSFEKMQAAIAKAYIATGKSAEDANRDIEAMFAAEKQGGEATAEAIKKITDQMNLQQAAAQALPQILNDLSGGLNSVTSLASTLGADDQAGFDRLSRLVNTTVETMRAAGKSEAEIFAAITPSLDQLAEAQKKMGFQASGALAELLKFREFDAANKEVAASIDGVNMMLSALGKTGRLTQQDFTDLTAIAVDGFDKMIAGGLSEDEALRRMQPTLQQIWELQQKGTLTVDENTQALLDQAEAQGMVGEEFKSTSDQMLDILKAIAIALGAELPDAAMKGAQKTKDAITKIGQQGESIDSALQDGIVTTLEQKFPDGASTADGAIADAFGNMGDAAHLFDQGLIAGVVTTLEDGMPRAAADGAVGTIDALEDVGEGADDTADEFERHLFPVLRDGLIDAAEDGVKGVIDALDEIPEDIDIGIHFDVDVPPDVSGDIGGGAATGGYMTPHGLQHFGFGGFVQPWTKPTGLDTQLVLAAPGELFLNAGQQERTLALMEAGILMARELVGSARGVSPQRVTVENHFHISAVDAKSFEDLARRNPRAIIDPLKTSTRRNTRGAHTDLSSLLRP